MKKMYKTLLSLGNSGKINFVATGSLSVQLKQVQI